MRFLTLAFDLFNSRQSFYILCPLWDTDADSLQGFPRYTSLHHPSRMYQNREGKYVIQRGLFSTEINMIGAQCGIGTAKEDGQIAAFGPGAGAERVA